MCSSDKQKMKHGTMDHAESSGVLWSMLCTIVYNVLPSSGEGMTTGKQIKQTHGCRKGVKVGVHTKLNTMWQQSPLAKKKNIFQI
jgi:hypothetical protein